MKEKEKLSFFEKRAFKKFLKKSRKIVDDYKSGVKEYADYKDKLMTSIKEFSEVLEIEDDDGTDLAKVDLNSYTIEYLEEVFLECLKQMERIVE